MKYSCLIKPNFACIYYGKVRENPDLPSGQSYDISEKDKGFIAKEPGLKFINTITCLSKNRTVPLMIANETNRHFKLYRHGLMVRIAPINETKIGDATSIITLKVTVQIVGLSLILIYFTFHLSLIAIEFVLKE